MKHSVAHISDLEIIARLAMAALLCGLVGLEREARAQSAGWKTHILVGVGAALFTMISAYGFEDWTTTAAAPGLPVSRVDPTRIAAQVVAGVGFLGAGAIMHQGLAIKGLTTAATLWIVAAIGMSVGIGFYFAAGVTVVVVLLSLILLRRVSPYVHHYVRSDVVILEMVADTEKHLGRAFAYFLDNSISIEAMTNEADDEDHHHVRLNLRMPAVLDELEVLDALREINGITDVRKIGSTSPEAR